jgi:hypothetical protein
VKAGFQIDYTNANNTSQIFAFDTAAGLGGPVLALQGPTGTSSGGAVLDSGPVEFE